LFINFFNHMKKSILTLILIASSSMILWAQSTVAGSTPFFTRADAFFKKYVFTNGVDYKNIKGNPADLNALVTQIASFPLSGQNKATQKAFYLNAYNILVIKNVIDHYPIAKPTDVVGFFEKFYFSVGGVQLSLSDIENKKIRPDFNDARVHFALVCAAKSCPPLANYAFTPDKVENQLETLTRAALNNNSFIMVDNARMTVQLSEILNWYRDDFLLVEKSLLGYVNRYRNTPIPTSYRQSFYTYNWLLNEKK